MNSKNLIIFQKHLVVVYTLLSRKAAHGVRLLLQEEFLTLELALYIMISAELEMIWVTGQFSLKRDMDGKGSEGHGITHTKAHLF